MNMKFIGFAFVLSISFNNVSAQTSQTTLRHTITLDWDKKALTDNTLPFDWPFIVKVENISENARLQLSIESIDNKTKKPFSHRISFPKSSSTTVQAVFDVGLAPNRSYKMTFSSESEPAHLSEDEMATLDDLKIDPKFINEIKAILYKSDYFSLTPDPFNTVVSKYLHQYLPEKKFDLTKVSSLNASIQLHIADMGVSIFNIGQLINDMIVILNKNGLEIKSKDYITPQRVYFIPSTLKYSSEEEYIEYLKFIKVNTELDSSRYLNLSKDDPSRKAIDDAFKKINLIENEFSNMNAKVQNWVDDNLILILISELQVWESLGVTSAEGDTKASVYISQSAGVGYSISTDKISSFLCYSFYSRPVNMEIPLSHYRGWDAIRTRLCLNVGFTFNDITTNKNAKVSGILGDKAIVVGAGFRLLSFLKVDVNSLIYHVNDPNPLIANKHVNASPLIGLTINMNIAKLLAGQANPFSDLQTLFH
jgi:hypothetical protein